MNRRLWIAGAVLAAVLVCASDDALAAYTLPPEYRSVAVLLDPQDTASPLDLLSATFGQVGADAFLSLHTRRAWTPSQLASERRSLCFYLYPIRASKPATGRVCVTDRGALRYEPLAPDGTLGPPQPLHAEVMRRDDHSFEARVPLAGIRLTPGLHRWQARSVWAAGSYCRRTRKRPQGCVDTVPDKSAQRVRIVHVRLAACGPAPPGLAEPVNGGPPATKAVALTFDDGPGAATPGILKVLEQDKVPATFFMVGDEVAAGARLVRQILHDGDMVGDHSWNHANLAKGGKEAEQQLVQTNAEILRVSRFEPCLFRAPFGATSPELIREAGALGMTTIQWDVDPRDWSRPGVKAIVRRVLRQVRPGSIVVLHDGGGNREQTVAALPDIISQLRRRGYGFVTVNGLLGIRPVYVR